MSSAVTGDVEVDDGLAKRNALLLAMAQSLGGAAASIIIATGSLAGYMLAENKALATLPVSAMVLGTALGTLPAGMIMERFGRRSGFIGATIIAILAGLLAAYAILQNLFGLFTAACCLTGFTGAFVHQYRFAATDTASDGFKPKAISWVLAGGVLAGVVGPQAVIWTKDLFAPILFAGTYVAQAGLALLAIGFLFFLKIPKPPRRQKGERAGRPLLKIVRQPRFVVAAACGITSFSLMSLVMTATPLAMIACGFTETEAALGIQWHVLAMFGPSFFTGSLIVRFGKERIVAVGLLLLAACSVVALMGIELANFWAALILLGLGWNFGFIGATAMLVDTYRPEERTMVQATNDFMVFGFVAFASFSSGQVLELFGWNAVNWIVLPFVGLSLILLSWLLVQERAATAS